MRHTDVHTHTHGSTQTDPSLPHIPLPSPPSPPLPSPPHPPKGQQITIKAPAASEMTVGSVIVLECVFSSGNAATSVTWLLDGQPVTEANVQVVRSVCGWGRGWGRGRGRQTDRRVIELANLGWALCAVEVCMAKSTFCSLRHSTCPPQLCTSPTTLHLLALWYVLWFRFIFSHFKFNVRMATVSPSPMPWSPTMVCTLVNTMVLVTQW